METAENLAPHRSNVDSSALAGGDALLKAAPGCAATELEGETVILNLDKGLYYGLNPVGSVVWTALQSPVSLDGICAAVLDRYNDAESDRVRRDVTALLEKMRVNGLVESSN